MATTEENRQFMERLEGRIKKIEDDKKNLPIDEKIKTAFKEFEDIKSYDLLKVRLLHAGLPIFTAVPTYTGFQGEMVVYDSGSGLVLYSYIDGTWQTTSGITDHGALSGLDDDDHSVIYYNKTAIDAFAVKLTGNQSVGGVKAFTSFPTTPSSAPTTDYQTANKKYVDDASSGIEILDNDMTASSVEISGTGVHEIVTYTIPAGKLSTSAGLRIRAIIYSDSEVWAGNIDLEIATTAINHEVANHTIVKSSGDTSSTWELDFIMFNQASASAQQFGGSVKQDDNTITILRGDGQTANTANATAIRITATRATGSEIGIIATSLWLVEYLPAP